MRRYYPLALIAFVSVAAATAQDRDAVVRYQFDKGAGGWKAINGAPISTREVEPGEFSLVYEYDVDSPKSVALGLERSMLGFRRIRFQVRCNQDVGLIALLVERKPGFGKSTFFSIPANTWQTVDLSLMDFVQADNPIDPSVPVPYEPERGQGFALGDASRDPSLRALQASLSTAPAPPRPQGKRKLEIRDVEWFVNTSTNDPPPSRFADSFERGFLQWLVMGNATAVLDLTGPLKKPAVKMSPTISGLATGVLYRTIGNFALSGTAGFSFDVVADVNTAIIISIEALDADGKKATFSSQLESIVGNRSVQHVQVRLSKMTRNGGPPLDQETIRSLAIVAIWPAAKSESSCWIGNLVAETAAIEPRQ